ncbi:hypothetical protein [Blastococcus sp. SYSU DS0973]
MGPSARWWGVACGLLGLAVLAVDDPARTAHLTGWINGLTAGLIIWALAWPLPCTLWPKHPPATASRLVQKPEQPLLHRVATPATSVDRPGPSSTGDS